MSQETLNNPNSQIISLNTRPDSTSTHPSPHTLIFFITGNPGLIGYYTTYLQTLHQLLSPAAKAHSAYIHIYGQSLAGFSDNAWPPPTTPYGLEEQIQILQQSLESLRVSSGPRESQQYDKIILIGHSVGSFILLELVRRLRASSSRRNIAAGILLFPTVTHIAQSPSGVKITRLFQWQNAPRKIGLALHNILSLLPPTTLTWLVAAVTRMPTEFAEVTTEFLRSKIGIWQALHMARDEMNSITDDKWDEEIWGVETGDNEQKEKPPTLIFYFGQNDHWVADHTRDALIAARGRTEGDTTISRPMMIIDQDGISHGFCLKHGETMAEKTKLWIEEILWKN